MTGAVRLITHDTQRVAGPLNFSFVNAVAISGVTMFFVFFLDFRNQCLDFDGRPGPISGWLSKLIYVWMNTSDTDVRLMPGATASLKKQNKHDYFTYSAAPSTPSILPFWSVLSRNPYSVKKFHRDGWCTLSKAF